MADTISRSVARPPSLSDPPLQSAPTKAMNDAKGERRPTELEPPGSEACEASAEGADNADPTALEL